jgi:hypothetical protein
LGSLFEVGDWHNRVVSQSRAGMGRGNLDKMEAMHSICGSAP